MINRLSISNYKSIKSLELSPKRVNIFVGEHNSGKSNILEALSWFSPNSLNSDVFPHLFRYRNVGDFFYDFDVTQPIDITTDEFTMDLRYAKNNNGALLNYFEGTITNPLKEDERRSNVNSTFKLDIATNQVQEYRGILETPFRTYVFKRITRFVSGYMPFLNPPYGDNIPSLIQSNTDWKKLVTEFFKSKGFRLIMKPADNDIEMAKDINDELYSFPYPTISETMQRFIFLLLALETNEKAILILDEPESNMYPFFVKDFAERIADNKTNQYFLSTHNPYLLGSLLEKTPREEVAVFFTKMKNYATTATLCNDEQIEELISSGSGAFFSLDNIMD